MLSASQKQDFIKILQGISATAGSNSSATEDLTEQFFLSLDRYIQESKSIYTFIGYINQTGEDAPVILYSSYNDFPENTDEKIYCYRDAQGIYRIGSTLFGNDGDNKVVAVLGNSTNQGSYATTKMIDSYYTVAPIERGGVAAEIAIETYSVNTLTDGLMFKIPIMITSKKSN